MTTLHDAPTARKPKCPACRPLLPCDGCKARRELLRLAAEIVESGDDASALEAAGWLDFVLRDAAVFRNPRSAAILDSAVNRARNAYQEDARAVRQVRDPIIGRDDDDDRADASDAAATLFVLGVS